MVETIDYTMPVPKEGKELFDALGALIAHFKKGGTLANAPFGVVIPAIEGFDKILEEAKSQYKDELSAYGMHTIWQALESKAGGNDVPV